MNIQVGLLDQSKNIRSVIDVDDTELTASLQKSGWLPQFPAFADENGVLIVGHRRIKIAERLGITPVIETIHFGNGSEGDAKRLELAIASNIGTAALSKKDRESIAELAYQHGYTMEQIGKLLGVDKATVSRDISKSKLLHDATIKPTKTITNPKGAGRPKAAKKGHGGNGASQIARIYKAMNDEAWRTLRQIEELTGDPEASISARLRDLRKDKFGGHMVEKRSHDGLIEYRLLNKTRESAPAKPVPVITDTRTGKAASPEDRVPEAIMRQIITPDLVGKGFRTCSDVRGEPCQLSPNVSETQFKECAAVAIGGAESFKNRKAHAKWDRYEEQKIRNKLIKVLEYMSPLDIPAAHRSKSETYVYNLGIASDLRELAEMVSADLLRAADTLELQEKYGHIQWKPTA